MKRLVIMLMLLAAVTPSLSGCFGKFSLVRKVYALNASVNDRILRHVVMWAFIIVPVYWVAGVVDLFVFNTIEFWSGHNPMAAGEKSFNYASGDTTFSVLATWKDDTITYHIDRYSGKQYQDTLVIRTDRSGATATATYRQPEGVTTFVAHGNTGGVGLTAALLLPPEPAADTLYN